MWAAKHFLTTHNPQWHSDVISYYRMQQFLFCCLYNCGSLLFQERALIARLKMKLWTAIMELSYLTGAFSKIKLFVCMHVCVCAQTVYLPIMQFAIGRCQVHCVPPEHISVLR